MKIFTIYIYIYTVFVLEHFANKDIHNSSFKRLHERFDKGAGELRKRLLKNTIAMHAMVCQLSCEACDQKKRVIPTILRDLEQLE